MALNAASLILPSGAKTASPAALLFSTGYMANIGVLGALAGRGDAIFADKLNHACLNDGSYYSLADFHRFPHNDVSALENLLKASHAKRKLIAVDAVFSMDGDIAPIDELFEIAQYSIFLMRSKETVPYLE